MGESDGGKYLGDFAPVLIMHETKQEEVKELNKDVDKRFREAIKKMGKSLSWLTFNFILKAFI